MTYKLTLILKSDLKDADRKKVVTKIKDSFGKAKVKENDWGQKPLAYPIEKQVSGYFVNMVVEPEQAIVKDFEKSIYSDSNIIRHLLLRSK